MWSLLPTSKSMCLLMFFPKRDFFHQVVNLITSYLICWLCWGRNVSLSLQIARPKIAKSMPHGWDNRHRNLDLWVRFCTLIELCICPPKEGIKAMHIMKGMHEQVSSQRSKIWQYFLSISTLEFFLSNETLSHNNPNWQKKYDVKIIEIFLFHDTTCWNKVN